MGAEREAAERETAERETMDSRDARYEIKMACEESGHAEVLMALRLHGLALREQHPRRRVQSVYLDTPMNAALRANLAGVSRREKLRFRWYGESVDVVRGRLERKVRENTLGWKHVLPLTSDVRVAGAERGAFLRALVEASDESWRAELEKCLAPVQWVSYQREYLASADGAVRVTLDRELRTWDQRVRRRLSCEGWSPVPRLLIVEVKCAPKHHARATGLVARLPLVVGRCSKFVLASEPAHGPLPSYLAG